MGTVKEFLVKLPSELVLAGFKEHLRKQGINFARQGEMLSLNADKGNDHCRIVKANIMLNFVVVLCKGLQLEKLV